MEAISYIISFAAGVFYVTAGYRLLRLSARTRERPELLLGLYFATTGQWYVFYNAPYLLGMGELPVLGAHIVEWVFAVGVVPYLLFLRSAFRPETGWATILVILCSLLLLAGSVLVGFGAGFSNTIDDPAYLMEWVGYTAPCVWMLAESARSHAAAKKRMRIGVCEPIVANRYLLLACFGFFQIAACAADLIWAHGNATGAAIYSSAGNLMMSGAEIASVSVLWLAFFPALFYRRWIDERGTRFAKLSEAAQP